MENYLTYIISPIIEFLETFIENQGLYAPVFLMIFEEIGIPLPLPGDIMIISYLGYKTTTGMISYWEAFILLLVCILTGASILYFLSRKYGKNIVLKIGKYINLNEAKLAYTEAKFRKYGMWAIIIGRHIPGFRIPVTVFSGIAKIKYKKFLLYTFISTIMQIPLYLALGRKLGPKASQIFHGNYIYYVLTVVPVLFFLLLYLIFLYKRNKKKKHELKKIK